MSVFAFVGLYDVFVIQGVSEKMQPTFIRDSSGNNKI